ncbi:UDP-2,4-diacetamido-2,4,6-trideoxy-beta-L-altropyranose hydrolase [Pseudomonas sp. X10]
MNIFFRVDASLDMGTGHVMRCLTLARALRDLGHQCLFASREHPGNLNTFVQSQGFEVRSLPMGQSQDSGLFHAHWLGASQQEDAQVCHRIIESFRPDWLVVDHYALDLRWEEAVMPPHCRLLVIDDLADRPHRCDVLLDQNLGKKVDDYRPWVPDDCMILTGPFNALLRSEFAALRGESLSRRSGRPLHEVLIALGGVDQYNHTGAILEALKSCELPGNIRFTVVLGATAPHLQAVREMAISCPWSVEVLCGISDMAERMASADLAIGAGGGTTWERCCLGLPTLLVILAENQKPAGLALEATGSIQVIDLGMPLVVQLQSAFSRLGKNGVLYAMSVAASAITDGLGVERLLARMGVDP